MDDSWVDQFKAQIEKLRDRKILWEEKTFNRIEHFLVRSVVCFTDVFLNKIKKAWDERVPTLLRKMRNMLLDTFRCALKSSVCGEELNLPRFLICFQEFLRLRQKRFELSNYKLFHSLALETGPSCLMNVECCFVVDFETSDPSRRRFPLFDFSIAGFENIKGRIFDPDGREIIDILDPKLVTRDWFRLPNLPQTPMPSEGGELVKVCEGEP